MRGSNSTRKDVEHFDRWSDTYERSWLQRLLLDRAHAAALDAAPSAPDSLLEVGCGTGRLLGVAHVRWPEARLLGVDAAACMARVARERTPDATFFVGTAEARPLSETRSIW